MSFPEDMSKLEDLKQRNMRALHAAKVWGFTYDVYLLHYLKHGPVSFGQLKPVARANIPQSNGVASAKTTDTDLLDDTDLLADLRAKYKEARGKYRDESGSARLRWLEELEFALKALEKLHSVHQKAFEEYLKLCAWQVIQSTRDVKDSMSDEGKDAFKNLANNTSAPDSNSDLKQLGDASISDERSELQIVSGEYPRYTYQVTIDRPFSEVCSVIGRSMGVGEARDPKEPLNAEAALRWQREAGSKLLNLGPALGDEPVNVGDPNDLLILDYIFPVRVQPDEDDWTGEEAQVAYRTDLSQNSSTLRLDFSLVKSDDKDKLLEEDSGYYLIRKSIAKVGRTDLIVQRNLWFANRAFGMNAALRPFFKMMVDHRVLREFATLCETPVSNDVSTRPPASVPSASGNGDTKTPTDPPATHPSISGPRARQAPETSVDQPGNTGTDPNHE